MPAFSHFVRARAPKRTVVIPPSAWADDAPKRPTGNVAIGLRLLSERDLDVARAESAKHAVAMFAKMGDEVDERARIEAYNDCLMRWAVGRACCDPNDVGKSFFENEEDTVRTVLTSAGVRRLWDEVERFGIEESPVLASASDEDLAELAARFERGVPESLTPGRKLRLRRLARFILDELRSVDDKTE